MKQWCARQIFGLEKPITLSYCWSLTHLYLRVVLVEGVVREVRAVDQLAVVLFSIAEHEERGFLQANGHRCVSLHVLCDVILRWTVCCLRFKYIHFVVV